MKKSAISIIMPVLVALVASFALAGCHSKSDEPTPPDPGKEPWEVDIPDGGTVLVYMVATNNLGSAGWDEKDIDEMCRGFKELSTANPSRLLVYHADVGATPALKEVTDSGTVTTLKTYTDGLPSVSVSRMRHVLADASVDSLPPLRGIIFWSHGSGWIEETGTYSDPDLAATPAPLSYGIDTGGRRMSIPALALALDGYSLRFIYFDCCLMGTVEVAYELRRSAQKIAAIATELPLEGMPYHTNMPHFFSGKADALEKAAQGTYSYYCSPEASNRSVAIGVYRTVTLDALADESRAVMASGALVDGSYTGIRFYRPAVTALGSFDMNHYYTALGAPQSWHDAYGNVVTWSAATPKSYSLDMTGFSGMGCNIFTSASDNRLTMGYTGLQWWVDVVAHHPVFNN